MAETVLFESQTVEGFSGGFVEIYPAPFVLVVGETYRVVWDGVEHTLVAFDTDGISELADITLAENGNITNWTFRIMYASPALTGTDSGAMAMWAYDLTGDDGIDTAESHTVAVYQVVADDAGDEEEGYGKQAAVILNYSRNPVYYPSVPKVWLTHPDSTDEAPVLVPYTYGEAVRKTVEPDFTDGDMAVAVDEGELVTELTVVKPEELVPENVRAGKTIAGIDGSYAGAEGAPLEVALDFSGGDTMEFTPEEGVAYSRVTIPKPENLTPENIAEGLDIAGVVGTLAAGGGGNIDAIIEGTITEIESNVQYIRSSAFADLQTLTKANFPVATSMGLYAFSSCKSLSEVNIPLATVIPQGAFSCCFALKSVDFPVATTIGNSAFRSCSALTTASFPAVTSIGGYAFVDCSALTAASFPAVTSIGMQTFVNCYKITAAKFPVATSVGRYMFQSCYNLADVDFPVATTIGSYAFYGCSNLTEVTFPAITSIGSYAFANCRALTSLYILTSAVPSLANASVFGSTPLSVSTYTGSFGSIFVRSSLLASFKAAAAWYVYSARMVGLTDDQIAALEG